MSIIVKKLGSVVPPLQCAQTFIGNTDFAADDIIDVKTSLNGAVAKSVTIVCGDDDSITVRFNVRHKLFPEVNDNQFQGDRGGERRFDFDNPVYTVDEHQEPFVIAAGETFTFSQQVQDIQVVAVGYAPRIIVST